MQPLFNFFFLILKVFFWLNIFEFKKNPILLPPHLRRDGRVVECGGLENR